MFVAIDIHNHVVFGVDDGTKDLETSIAMLTKAKEAGTDTIICTPHYRAGMFSYPKEKVEANFEVLKKEASKLGITLYLGCEYHVGSEMMENLKSRRVHTLADSDYVLAEFSSNAEYSYIRNQIARLQSGGYIPIIAHIERCECFFRDTGLVHELIEMGALIQINADGVMGAEGRAPRKLCKSLLKSRYVHFIASDSHDTLTRLGNFKECLKYVEKKYGGEYADTLFRENALRMISND